MMDSVQYQAWLVGFKDVLLSRCAENLSDMSTREGRRALGKSVIRPIRMFCAATIPSHAKRSLFSVRFSMGVENVPTLIVTPHTVATPDAFPSQPMSLPLVVQTQATPVRLFEVYIAHMLELHKPTTVADFKSMLLRPARKFYGLVAGLTSREFKMVIKHMRRTGDVRLVCTRRVYAGDTSDVVQLVDMKIGSVPRPTATPRVRKPNGQSAETTVASSAPVLVGVPSGNLEGAPASTLRE